MQDLIVTYDVNTLTPKGRGRLRKVAKICEGFGQRVQESVFEVSVTEADKVRFLSRLLKVIEPTEDSLRIYLLRGGRTGAVECHGLDRFVDFRGTLAV
jgi:CRISPR-associated endoribonuclease Cas2